jgi:hypothetical protein
LIPRRHINRPGDRVHPYAGGPGAHLPDPPAGRVLSLQALLIPAAPLFGHAVMSAIGILGTQDVFR